VSGDVMQVYISTNSKGSIMKFASLVLLLIVAGCSFETSVTSTPNAKQSADPVLVSVPVKPDPVSAMKDILARVARGTPRGATAHDLHYDVKKTDSMITPYTATVTFRDEYSIPSSEWKDDARAASLKSPITVQLAWQDEHWVVKELYVNALGLKSQQVYVANVSSGSSLHDWIIVFSGM